MPTSDIPWAPEVAAVVAPHAVKILGKVKDIKSNMEKLQRLLVLNALKNDLPEGHVITENKKQDGEADFNPFEVSLEHSFSPLTA